jgi:hypothetical protein
MTTSSRKQRGPRMVKRSTGRCAESTPVPPQCPAPPRARPRLHPASTSHTTASPRFHVLGHGFTSPPRAIPRLHLAFMSWGTVHLAPTHPHHPTVIPTGASRRLFFAFASRERAGSRSGGTSLPPSLRFVGRGFNHDKPSSGLSFCGSRLQPRQSELSRKGASAPEGIAQWNSLRQ